MKKEIYHFYYSPSQRKRELANKEVKEDAYILVNGLWHMYTESINVKHGKKSNWKDAHLVATLEDCPDIYKFLPKSSKNHILIPEKEVYHFFYSEIQRKKRLSDDEVQSDAYVLVKGKWHMYTEMVHEKYGKQSLLKNDKDSKFIVTLEVGGDANPLKFIPKHSKNKKILAEK